MAHDRTALSDAPIPNPSGQGVDASAPAPGRGLSAFGQALVWLLGLGLLALVFALYAHPTLRVTLAEMVWACFN